MKRFLKSILIAAVLALALSQTALAANVVKYTFTDQTLGDVTTTGTIHASIKTTKNGNVAVCDYYNEPNEQYLGQFEDIDASISIDTSPDQVRDYCVSHFDQRQF